MAKRVSGQDSLYVSAVTDNKTGEAIIKIVNASGKEKAAPITLEGVRKMPPQASLTVLQSNDLNSVNTFEKPQNVVPKESTLAIKGKLLHLIVAPYSFSVVKIKM